MCVCRCRCAYRSVHVCVYSTLLLNFARRVGMCAGMCVCVCVDVCMGMCMFVCTVIYLLNLARRVGGM